MLFGPETWLIIMKTNWDSQKLDQKFTAIGKLPARTTAAQPLPRRLYRWTSWEQNSLRPQKAPAARPQRRDKVQHQDKNHRSGSLGDMARHLRNL